MRRTLAMIWGLIFLLGALTACISNNAVLTVGDQTATVGEATFVLRELETMYVEQYGVEIWNQGFAGKTFDEVAKESAMESLTRLYVSKNVADENGVTLTESEMADIELLIGQYFDIVSEETLKEDGILMDDVRNIFVLNALGEKLMNEELMDFVVDEERLNADLANDIYYQQIQEFGTGGILEQVTAQQVLISTVEEDGTEYTEEERAVAMTKAEEVLQRALDGESFDGLVAKYSQDLGSDDNGGIYTFYRGELPPEYEDFEELAFTMKMDEVKIAEGQYGYHIVKKLEHIYPDETQIETIENYKAYLVEQYTMSQRQDAYDAFYEEWKDDYDVKINQDLWDQVRTSNDL